MSDEDYERGYRDGESSGYADWLGEILDYFPDEGIDSPASLIQWMRQHVSASKTGAK